MITAVYYRAFNFMIVNIQIPFYELASNTLILKYGMKLKYKIFDKFSKSIHITYSLFIESSLIFLINT